MMTGLEKKKTQKKLGQKKIKHKHLCRFYLLMNAESENWPTSELPIMVIAKGNNDLFYYSTLVDHHFLIFPQWIHK